MASSSADAAGDTSDNQAVPSVEPQTSCNIFISYQWSSQQKAKRLYAELVAYEFLEVFMDIYKIKAGHNLYASLASNIQQADVILACVSREYVKSKNCEREIIYADAFNKSIMPLYIEKIPIQELGSIGFILVRERYCNLYKNEKIFDNLKGSDELNDIIDGIASIINAKKISVQLPLKRVNDQLIEEPSFDQAIIRFRKDSPLDEVFSNKKEPSIQSETNEKEENDEEDENETSNKTPKQLREEREIKKKRENYPKLPKKDLPARGPEPSKISENLDKPSSEQVVARSNSASVPVQRSFGFFQVHPVMKELKFLVVPKVLLEPLGDRFKFVSADVKRGGEKYYKPVGWIRYGLKISKLYPDIQKWLGKDGNPDEWSVVYHGFKTDPVKTGVQTKLFSKNQFAPNFRMSQNLHYVSDKDVNEHSDGYNSACGMGIFFSSRAEVAEEVTAKFVLNGVKYKMLLQCRAHPRKIRVPQKNRDLCIVNSMDHVRPYGILLKEVK